MPGHLARENLENICPLQDIYSNKKSLGNNYLRLSRNILSIPKSHNDTNSEALYKIYLELCLRMGLGNPSENLKPKYPYNLLISPNWISIIKRSTECAHGFSLNALAFAGYLLNTEKSDKIWLTINGPIKLLEEVVSND